MDRPPDAALPSELGRYQIRSLIGRGGMGDVYGAFDPKLDRVVALKTITAGSDNPSLVERLYREARACGRLHHPNIVSIFDLGESDGMVFIAMEWLQGENLAEAMAAGRLTLDDKLRALIQTLDALGYAHGEGIIHRDIKPSNVWVQPNGHVKLLDFGLARLATLDALTLPGEVMGTPFYMSPEQLKGQGVDTRSDVFSTGVLGYELLAERRPFEGESLTAVIIKVLSEAPPPIDVPATVAFPELESIVGKAMAKAPEDRYQSAEAMADDLRAFVDRHRDAIRQMSATARTPGPDTAARLVVDGPTEIVTRTAASHAASDAPTMMASTSPLPASARQATPESSGRITGPMVMSSPVPNAQSSARAPANAAASAASESRASAGAALLSPPQSSSRGWVLPVVAIVVLGAGIGAYLRFGGSAPPGEPAPSPQATVEATPSSDPTPSLTPSPSPSPAATTPTASAVPTPAAAVRTPAATSTPAPTTQAAAKVAIPLATPSSSPTATQPPPFRGGRRGLGGAGRAGFSGFFIAETSSAGVREALAARLEARGLVRQLHAPEARWIVSAKTEIPLPQGRQGSPVTVAYRGDIELRDKLSGKSVQQHFEGQTSDSTAPAARSRAAKELSDKMMEFLNGAMGVR